MDYHHRDRALHKADVKATTTIPGGKIRGAGTVTAAQTTGTSGVIGGTGKYANVLGTISLRNLTADGSRGLSIYRLRFP